MIICESYKFIYTRFVCKSSNNCIYDLYMITIIVVQLVSQTCYTGCHMITVLFTYDKYMIDNSQVSKQSHFSTSTFGHIPPHTYQQNHTVLPLSLLSLCTPQMVGFSFPEHPHMDVLQPKSSIVYCLIPIQLHSVSTPIPHPPIPNVK